MTAICGQQTGPGHHGTSPCDRRPAFRVATVCPDGRTDEHPGHLLASTARDRRCRGVVIAEVCAEHLPRAVRDIGRGGRDLPIESQQGVSVTEVGTRP